MTITALSPDSPASSGEIRTIDIPRLTDVQQRHALLSEYLQLNQLDALLIRDPANYAWLTCGSENVRQGLSEPIAAILVTPESRVILCSNVDSGQIFDRDLMGLGFLLKERPWTEETQILKDDVCRGRKVACDCSQAGTVPVAADLDAFRHHRGTREVELLRELGTDLSHALEATGRNMTKGSTECEVAGHLAHRLVKNQIQPMFLQVMADGQGWRYRNWGCGEDRLERFCVISVIGRRHGLYLAATRTISFGAPPHELAEVHQLATLIQATGIYFSQPGWAFSETWSRVARIYEKFGVPDEWRAAEQADLIGYRPSERKLIPTSADKFATGQLVHWHPSVRSSRVGDTFLITEDGIENLTPVENWPVVSVSVKGTKVDRPGILIRESS